MGSHIGEGVAEAPRSQNVANLAVLFSIAFVLNLVWEFAHVRLYTTKVSSLFLVWQSVKDAWWILLVFLVSPNPLVMAPILLVFSWAVERHAITTKRWEYAPTMPRVLGVGLSPLLELAVTGLVALYIVTLLTA